MEVLYEQLEKLKEIVASGEIDVSESIKALETKISDKRKELYDNLTGWQRVQLSRHPERPYTLFYIQEMCNKFIELHGDRYVRTTKPL